MKNVTCPPRHVAVTKPSMPSRRYDPNMQVTVDSPKLGTVRLIDATLGAQKTADVTEDGPSSSMGSTHPIVDRRGRYHRKG